MHAYPTYLIQNLPNEVTFTTTDPSLPLPSPNYLALHALCCEVAQMSGAADWLSEIQEDMEETRVLAKDGSMAHLLSVALSALAPSKCVSSSFNETKARPVKKPQQ